MSSLLDQEAISAVVIVENGSGQECCMERVRELQGQDPRVHALFVERNKGYAGGSNIGIRAALDGGYDGILMSSNDVVFQSQSVAELRHVAVANPSAGIVSAVVYRADAPHTVYFAGAILNKWTGRAPFVRDVPSQVDVVWVTAVLTCAALVRKEVFETIGLIDEQFFFQYDDIDLSARCIESGWRLGVATKAHVTDRIGGTLAATSAERTYYAIRNRAHFIRKHIRAPQALVAYAVLAATWLANVLVWTVEHDRPRIMASTLGLRDFLVGAMGRRGEPGHWDWHQVV